MSRYVDVDYILTEAEHAFSDWSDYEWLNLITYHQNAPSIDIVPCKECRYCKKKRGTFKGEPITFYRCEENNRDVESDDYCSWGEREGE